MTRARTPLILVATLLLAACSTSVRPTTTLTAADDYRHNGVNVVEVARASANFDWDGVGLPEDVAYRSIILWTRFASVGVSDDRSVNESCVESMKTYEESILRGEPDEGGIGVLVINIGTAMAHGAAAAVEPGSPEQQWLSECAATFDDAIEETASEKVRCDAISDRMDSAASDEEHATWENLFVATCLS